MPRQIYGNQNIYGTVVANQFRSGQITDISGYYFPQQVGNNLDIMAVVNNISGNKEVVFTPITTLIPALSGALQDKISTINSVPPDVNKNFNIIEGNGIEVLNISAGQIQIQLYTSPSVSSFTNNSGNHEIGETVGIPTLNWSFNKPMNSVSINQGLGTQTNITPNSTTDTINFPRVSTSPFTFTWTITATDNKNNSTSSSTSFNWLHRSYWGVSTSTSLSGFNTHSSLLSSLTNSELTSNKNGTKTFNPSSQYIWYVFPSSFGTPTFTINGFSTTFNSESFTLTNQYGISVLVKAYRSIYVQNGSGISVVVS